MCSCRPPDIEPNQQGAGLEGQTAQEQREPAGAMVSQVDGTRDPRGQPGHAGQQISLPGAHGATPGSSAFWVSPVPVCEPSPVRRGRFGAKHRLGLKGWPDGLGHSPNGFLSSLGKPAGRLCDDFDRLAAVLGRSDSFPGWRAFGGDLGASEIGVEGHANEGVEADSEPFAPGFGVGFEGGRKSEIKGHGVIMALSWPHVVDFPPVLQDGG